MRNPFFTSLCLLGAITVIGFLSGCSGGNSSVGDSSGGSSNVAPTVQTLIGAIQGLERSWVLEGFLVPFTSCHFSSVLHHTLIVVLPQYPQILEHLS
jgi:hypothetical protein